jgi:Tol biopolymer transport system component
VFSPDGSRIAFAGNLPGQSLKIYWVSSDGGGLHEIAPDVTSQVDPTWLPNGSIVFGEPPHIVAESGKPKAIYISNIETQKTSKLPGSDGWFSPRVSPDGRFVAAMSIDMKRLGLFDFKEGKWRTLDKPGLLDNPFWSHDNRWVYFNNGRDFLWRVRARDGRKEPVLSFANIPGPDCVPRRFSPEGALLFSCRRRNSDIYAISLE